MELLKRYVYIQASKRVSFYVSSSPPIFRKIILAKIAIPAVLYIENNSLSSRISTIVSQLQIYYKLIENTCQVLTHLHSYKVFKHLTNK